MGKKRLTAAQQAQLLSARKNSPLGHSHTENSAVQPPNAISTDEVPSSRKTRTSSQISILTEQIHVLKTSLDSSADEIIDLKAVIADLRGSNQAQASLLHDLSQENDSLRLDLAESKSLHAECSLKLSDVLSSLSTEQDLSQKRHKRIKRLENDKKKARITKRDDAKASADSLSTLRNEIRTQSHTIDSLTIENNRLNALFLTRTVVAKSQAKKLQAERKVFKMRAERAQHSLALVRKQLRTISTWNAKKDSIYSMETRRLVLRLCQAGCPESKINDVILSCAAVFGVNVVGCTLSARTVGRMKKEGGYISLIQLGREITMTYGFTESSDGTSHRKTNLECRSISAMLPTYAPGVDDTDPTTWAPRTRFIEVASSLSHTSDAQLEGTKLIAAKIAQATSNAPSSIAKGIFLDWKEWFRKQLAQMSDHAADQARKHELTSELKHEIVIEDLGTQELEALSIEELLDAMLSISEEEITAKSGKPVDELTPEERGSIVRELVNAQLGADSYDSLSDDLKLLADFLIFGGCCGHKDMNAFKGGCRAMGEAWPKGGEPTLLANKANSTTIRLGERDSAAVQAAEDASTRGIVKAMALLGALFRHKDEDKGYQDRYLMFMEQKLSERCDPTDVKRFPATSQTRYGSYGRAAAVVTEYHDLLLTLIGIICDGKTKAGANHVEESAMKALRCPRTMAEVVAAALYSLCVSWPYMQAVRKKDSNNMLPNLLDLTPIHRKAPEFCKFISENPSLLLSPDALHSSQTLTLDGKPFHDLNVLVAAQTLAPELPDLTRMISAMFSGAGDTWVRFTPEFAIGGPIDMIPPEIRPKLYITSTNDPNEGGLGSYRVHIRYHPNSTPQSFSAMERYKRNNTEAFAAKYITAEDLLYVMREVRKEDASGASAAFRQSVVEELERKAQAHREKVRIATDKRTKRDAELRNTGVERNRATITKMTVTQLKAQYDVYKHIVKDEVIMKTTLVSIPRRNDKLEAVLDALTRYEEKLSRSPDVPESPEIDIEMVDGDGDDEFAHEEEDAELYK